MKTTRFIKISIGETLVVLSGMAVNLWSDALRPSLEPYRYLVVALLFACTVYAIISKVHDEQQRSLPETTTLPAEKEELVSQPSAPDAGENQQPRNKQKTVRWLIGMGLVFVLSFLWLYSFPQPEITHVCNQMLAQYQAELIAGDKRVEFALRGNIEGFVLPTAQVYVVAGKDAADTPWLLGTAQRTGNTWQIVATLPASANAEAIRYRLLPLIAHRSPDASQMQAAFRQGEKNHRLVTLTVKTVTLTIKALTPDGAYATLRGEAINLTDRDRLEIQTRPVEDREDDWKTQFVTNVEGQHWERMAPMREANRQIGQVLVRVRFAPANDNCTGIQVVSKTETYSAPPPEIKFTRINRQPVTSACRLAPNTEYEISGEAQNFLEKDTLWLGVNGADGPQVKELRLENGGPTKNAQRNWSGKIKTGTGTEFLVKAGYFSLPATGSAKQFREADGTSMTCQRQRR